MAIRKAVNTLNNCTKKLRREASGRVSQRRERMGAQFLLSVAGILQSRNCDEKLSSINLGKMPVAVGERVDCWFLRTRFCG